MDTEPSAARSLTRRWLDPPDLPGGVSLDQLRSAFSRHQVIQEAWLLRTLITPSGGVAKERTEIALAFDPPLAPQQDEGPQSAATDVVVELVEAAKTAGLDVQGWVFVNDAIHSKVERHGVKIYSRAAS